KAETEGVRWEFICPAWNPLNETRDKFTKRTLERIERELERKLDQTESLMAAVGNQKAPGTVSTDHFDWLVQYQVKGRRSCGGAIKMVVRCVEQV
ncbi:MAG: hypothetical protein ACJ8BC_02270, partial [Gemmatimonadales bacterium]